MKKSVFIILIVLFAWSACKKDVYVGKDPYAGAKPALNIKVKTVTEIAQVVTGAVFHLSGEGFSQYKDSGMVVKFNDVPGKIVRVSDSAIDAEIPAIASSGLVTLTIGAQVFAGPQIRVKGAMYIDPNFISVPGATGDIYCIAALSSGKFILGGAFQDYGNSGEKDGLHGIAVIKSDGSLDNTFQVGKGFNGSVHALIGQSDGKIVAGGDFTDYNDRYLNDPIYIKGLVRLNPNGLLDTMQVTTQAGNHIILPTLNAYFDGSISKILSSPIDGKMTIFGNFNYFIRKDFTKATADGLRDTVLIDSVRMEGLVRLNEDGSFDSTFNYNKAMHGSPAGLNGFLVDALLLNDSRILLVGNFSRYHGQAANRLVAIDQAGNADPSFDIGTGPSDQVTAAGLLANGQILIAGLFSSINGKPEQRVALLNTNGSLATSFNVGSGVAAGPDSRVDHILALKNNKLLLTGTFDYFSGIKRKGSIVLEPNGSVSADYNNLGALELQAFHAAVGTSQIISTPGINGLIMVGSFDNFDLVPVDHIVQLRY